MPIPQEVSELVERFERNRESYRSSEYNEAEVRLELINPFFNGLDWDMYNEAGYAEGGKTEHEKSLIQRQIDQLAYELYGLTDEEIRIVEEAAK